MSILTLLHTYENSYVWNGGQPQSECSFKSQTSILKDAELAHGGGQACWPRQDLHCFCKACLSFGAQEKTMREKVHNLYIWSIQFPGHLAVENQYRQCIRYYIPPFLYWRGERATGMEMRPSNCNDNIMAETGMGEPSPAWNIPPRPLLFQRHQWLLLQSNPAAQFMSESQIYSKMGMWSRTLREPDMMKSAWTENGIFQSLYKRLWDYRGSRVYLFLERVSGRLPRFSFGI